MFAFAFGLGWAIDSEVAILFAVVAHPRFFAFAFAFAFALAFSLAYGFYLPPLGWPLLNGPFLGPATVDLTYIHWVASRLPSELFESTLLCVLADP